MIGDWRQDIGQRLAELSGCPTRMYSTFDFGRQRDERCVSVVMARNPEVLLGKIRAGLVPGLVAFIGTNQWLGQEKNSGYEVVVGPGDSQFDILRLARSDGVNYGLGTEDLIARLQAYDREFGIDVVRASTDTVMFDLLATPPNPKRLAEDLFDFCPDLGNGPGDDVDSLAGRFCCLRRVELWWD